MSHDSDKFEGIPLYNTAAAMNDIGITFAIHEYQSGSDELRVEEYLEEVDALHNELGIDWAQFQVRIPEQDLTDGWRVRNIQIQRDSPGRIRTLLVEGVDRDPGYSESPDQFFTMLYRRDVLWMSDTRAEIMEHMPALRALDKAASRSDDVRVLINGLGIGMILKYAIRMPQVSHIDVVEIDQNVIDAIGPLYQCDKLSIHHGDAYEVQLPPNDGWDVVWHDIWESISDENLSQMRLLKERYQYSASWQGCWQEAGCRALEQRLQGMKDAAERGDWETLDRLYMNF